MPKRLLTILGIYLFTLSQMAMSNNNALPKEVKVGIYHNPPLIFADSSGRAKGIFIDILEYISKKQNWKLNYREYTLEDALIAAKTNQIELIPAIAYSDERAEYIRYSKDVVFTNWGVIYTSPDSQIKSITDLTGKEIGIEKGDIHAKAFINLLKEFKIKANIHWYENQQHLISAIKRNAIEAIVINKVFGYNQNINKELRETSILFNPVHLHFVTGPASVDLMNELNIALGHLLKDSPDVYHSIIDQWLLAPIEKEKPLWLKIIGISGIAIISILVLYLIFLRIKVKRKNKDLKKELKLRALNEKLILQLENEKALILNSIDDQVVFIDSDFRILWVNKAYKDKSIHNYDNQIGKKCYEVVYGSNKPCDFCVNQECTKPDTTKVHEHFDELTQRHFITKTSPVYNGDSSPMGFVKVITDITEKKKNEKELIAAKEKAEESDFLKSAFLANMSHEIRTPMNAIIGFSELLEDADLTTKEKQTYLNIIQSNGQQLLKLISDILIFSQLESGHIELQYSNFNISETLNEIQQQFISEKDKLNKPEVDINLSLEGITNSETVHSDQIRLKQIIFNLMTNALKFTNKGRITLGAYIEKNMLVIYVRDTGIGIPKDQLDNIFKRFSQVENTQLKKAAGSGLGLTIANDLITLLHGHIEVESTVDVGSTFKVYHPLMSQHAYRELVLRQGIITQ